MVWDFANEPKHELFAKRPQAFESETSDDLSRYAKYPEPSSICGCGSWHVLKKRPKLLGPAASVSDVILIVGAGTYWHTFRNALLNSLARLPPVSDLIGGCGERGAHKHEDLWYLLRDTGR